MFKWNLRSAWKNISRHQVSTGINILGLSIGMAAALFIFLWVQNELHYDSYHKDSDRIFRIKNFLTVDKGTVWVWENSPLRLGMKARTDIADIEAVAHFRPMVFDAPFVKVKDEVIKETQAAAVDSNWFDFFDYKVLSGNLEGFKKQPFSVVLTESNAKKYFGSTDPVGKMLQIDTARYMVQAVVADNPTNTSFRFELMLSTAARLLHPGTLNNDMSWGNFNYNTYVKLHDPKKAPAVAALLEKIVADARQSDNLKISLLPLKDLRFENDLQQSSMDHGNRKAVGIFAFLGIILLFIACINYVNLTTARATLRAREVSIKKIVGAGRGQLIFQFILESVLISCIALLLSILFVKLGLPVFNAFVDRKFSLFEGNASIWLITAAVLFSTILLTSFYPALLLSSFKPIAAFRGVNALKIRDTTLRRALVVVQFTISIVLIVGTIVVYQQLRFINTQQTGYDKAQVFSFSIPYKLTRGMTDEKQRSLTDAIKQELTRSSAIGRVTHINQESVIDATGFSSGDGNDWDGRDPDFRPAISFMDVDSSFHQLLNLDLAEGRWLQPANAGDAHNVVLNETAIREFNIRKPVIGQRFTSQGDTGVIVGVVKDFYYKSFHEKIGPVVIRNISYVGRNFLVQALPGKNKEALATAEKIWAKFFPATPLETRFLDDEFEKLYRLDIKMAQLIWTFSGIAIFLSCLGLFGLAAFTAQRRTKEIGIRKVLGASVPAIVRLLSKEFLGLVIISVVIASPIAWWAMHKWLEEFVYRIDISLLYFIAAGILALTVALLTISVHALRAAVSNPVETLRAE